MMYWTGEDQACDVCHEQYDASLLHHGVRRAHGQDVDLFVCDGCLQEAEDEQRNLKRGGYIQAADAVTWRIKQ